MLTPSSPDDPICEITTPCGVAGDNTALLSAQWGKPKRIVGGSGCGPAPAGPTTTVVSNTPSWSASISESSACPLGQSTTLTRCNAPGATSKGPNVFNAEMPEGPSTVCITSEW